MTIGERIKELRKALNKNQTDFGAKIGSPHTTIANWECGRREVSETVLLSIAREYGCSEEWLRTGEGEMFPARTWQEQVADYAASLSRKDKPGLQGSILLFMADLPSSLWDELEQKAVEFLEQQKKKPAD